MCVTIHGAGVVGRYDGTMGLEVKYPSNPVLVLQLSDRSDIRDETRHRFDDAY